MKIVEFIMPMLMISSTTALGSTSYATLPKTLTYCSEGSPTGFDPNRLLSLTDATASALTLYNRLVEFKRGRMKIEPGLAKRWSISEDGKVYTFYLRRGVKFHTTPWFRPTREFNAEDVIFTFERMRNPNMLFRKAYPTEFPDFHYTGLDRIISKIEALDEDRTVRFTLNTVHAPFLSNLAMPFASILSAEYATQLLNKNNPSDISWKPVGTGPFIFQEYVRDATIRFKSNFEYWKPSDVQLSKLIFAITPDPAVRIQKLRANECQVMSNPRLNDIDALAKDANFRVFSQPGFNITYLAYNTTHKPLDDVRVRRALDMAINKKAIIDSVYKGRAQIAVAPMSPLQWSYDTTLQDAPHDFEQARALLIEAAYPNKLVLSLWAPPSLRTNPDPRLTAEMIQADWGRIGVKTKIMTYEWGEYLKRANDGEHDLLLMNLISNTSDPDNWLRILSSGAIRSGNHSQWSNETFDDLIWRAVQTTDTAQRTQLYLRAQKIFKQEQPFTPIAYAMDYQAINKNVTGFKINPLGPTIFYGVGLN